MIRQAAEAIVAPFRPERRRAIREISAADAWTISTVRVFAEHHFEMPEHRDILGNAFDTFPSYEIEVPATNIYVIKHGRCIAEREEAYTKRCRVVREVTSQTVIPVNGHSSTLLHGARHVDGSVLSLALCGLENNYYHFNVEFLARYYTFLRANRNVDWIIFPERTPFHRDLIDILGLDRRKLLDVSEYPVIEADELVVPSLTKNWEPRRFRGAEGACKVWVPLWLKEAYGVIGERVEVERTERRIYVSRRRGSRRVVDNENELTDMLRRYGFVVVDPEEHSMGVQIALFKNAEMIIGPHGAGLINMSYCLKPATVLEIFPQYYHDPSFRVQAVMLGHRYEYYVGRTDNISGVDPRSENIVVDVGLIEEWVERQT